MHDDFSDLDTAFTLSEIVADPNLRTLYEHIVARMRKEAEGTPMGIVQQLLLERIASFYVYMKHKELVPVGSIGGYSSAANQKELNTFWLSMTEQFNKILAKKTPESIRTEAYQEVTEKVLKVIGKIKDPMLRDKLAEELLKEFSSVSAE